ncbi:MAG: sigma-54-dependent Fis family transcriptional regulator [Deltaproteobacteria bacterium]|jgi:two-component system, NtrC family, response regulator|nr:sigma-54-dependent Fis family transcriptional regulator [Deltaproteobacteria bacterium]
MKPIVLYVDDDAANLDTFKRAFRFDYEVITAENAAAGLEIVKSTPELALIVTDQRMPGMKGTEFLEHAMKVNPHAQRMILTAFTDLDALLSAIQKGHVYDYILKPWDRGSLKETLDRAISIYADKMERVKQLMVARSQNSSLKEMVQEAYDFTHIIGADGALKPILEQVMKVAAASSTVLVRGESGTGKELIAHAIHAASPRADASLVKLNCAALSHGVLESELFGHEKGSFTGAVAAKKGRFELADGGTLFLDEVGDLPESVQVKLLRVLQEKEFERVGGVESKKVDVRLVAATHQPLEKLVEEGRFRKDLFYRLNVIPITVPPLRERTQDIPALVDHFLAKFSTESGKNLSIDAAARQLLSDYEWPGNVRELRNMIERAVIMGEGELGVSDFVTDLDEINRTASTVESIDPDKISGSVLETIHDESAKELAASLRKAGGNVSEAARMMGIARSTLVYRLRKYRLI